MWDLYQSFSDCRTYVKIVWITIFVHSPDFGKLHRFDNICFKSQSINHIVLIRLGNEIGFASKEFRKIDILSIAWHKQTVWTLTFWNLNTLVLFKMHKWKYTQKDVWRQLVNCLLSELPEHKMIIFFLRNRCGVT